MIEFDFKDYGTKVQLETKWGFKVAVGWIESETDTIYCEEAPQCEKIGSPRGTYYQVWIWNQPKARASVAARFAEMLGKPVFRTPGHKK